tara:strand:- start:378 stop:1736 length:1359 start_codon:yes stop_codon:yes gene_type:complete
MANTLRRPNRISPQVALILGFFAIIGSGTILLSLPFASANNTATNIIDSLFTAASATGTVGLVVLETSTHWSRAGHIIILILMQVGGLGFMAGAILLFMALGRPISFGHRQTLAESMSLRAIGGVVGLAKRLLVFTIAVEIVGGLLLFFQFQNDKIVGPEDAVFYAVFHSVSAVTVSGFDLIPGSDSLRVYSESPLFLMTILFMTIQGDLGFLVVVEIFRKLRFSAMNMETKLVLVLNAFLWPMAGIGFALLEWQNANSLGGLPIAHRVTNAVFHGFTVRGAGFSTVDFSMIGELTMIFMILFMIVGGASASMSSGVRVNTIGALLAAMKSSLTGRPYAEAFGRTITTDRIHVSITILILYLTLLFVSVPVIFSLLNAEFSIAKTLFDTASLIGIVGLSTGLPSELSGLGKVFYSLMMFVGRLGPLLIALALLSRRARHGWRKFPASNLRVG